MKLKKLELENFRSYRNLNIEFDDNMNVIIGKNDVGKSTIMEALEIFFNNDLVKIDQSDLNTEAKNNNEHLVTIKISFILNGHENIIIDSTNPTNPFDEFLLNNEYLTLIKTFDCSKPIKATSIKLYLECMYPRKLADEPLINQTQTKLKKIIVDNNLSHFVQDNRINSQLRMAIYNNYLLEEERNDLVSIQIDLSKSSDDTKNLKSSIEKNLPLYFLFQSDRANKDSDKDVQNPLNTAIQKALLKPSIKDKLDEVERLMQDEITEIGNATIAKLNEMDPNIASSLRPDYSKTPEWKSVFKFSFTGDDIPINKRGSGVRRLILLNYFRAEADRQVRENNSNDVIYAIEEPETSQHPDYQTMLIEALLELANNNHHQVIITTHTPNIAKIVNLENIIPLIRDSITNEIIKFDDKDELLKSIISTLGILPNLNIENISAVKCIVCVEGKWDVEFLKNINESIIELRNIITIKDNNEILIIPMGGSTIEYWANENLLKKLQINQVHIYDSDIGSINPNKYSKYFESINNQGLNNFTFETKKREMENYIHPSIVKAIYTGFNHNYDDNWNMLDVIEEAAKSMHNNSESEKTWDEIDNDNKKKKLGNVKKRFNNELSKELQKEHLEELEAFEEIKEWFEKIKEATVS